MMPGRAAWLIVLVLVCARDGAVAAPRDPSGVWLTEDARARVRVETCGPTRDNLCGYIVWLELGSGEAPPVDRKNPDRRKASRQVLGHQLMLGLKPNADDVYEGLIYNADDGKSYDVNVWLDRSGELKVKGCLVSFLCKTESWTRRTDLVSGQLAAATGTPGGPRPDPEWASNASPPMPVRRGTAATP